jgi:hypothetical protein
MDARYQTATRRREARREVRNALGPSSDPAPGWESSLRAAMHLDGLVQDATGRYSVRLRDNYTGQYVTPSAALLEGREAASKYPKLRETS